MRLESISTEDAAPRAVELKGPRRAAFAHAFNVQYAAYGEGIPALLPVRMQLG